MKRLAVLAAILAFILPCTASDPADYRTEGRAQKPAPRRPGPGGAMVGGAIIVGGALNVPIPPQLVPPQALVPPALFADPKPDAAFVRSIVRFYQTLARYLVERFKYERLYAAMDRACRAAGVHP